MIEALLLIVTVWWAIGTSMMVTEKRKVITDKRRKTKTTAHAYTRQRLRHRG